MSMRLPAHLRDHRSAVKNATGYTDMDIYEAALLLIMAEAADAAAVARAGGDPDCGHAALYPNGRCRSCFEVRPPGPPPPDLTPPGGAGG